jgi:hypothetical protein
MTARPLDLWDDAIRCHDRRVYLSVLALGLAPERAREVTQAAWARSSSKTSAARSTRAPWARSSEQRFAHRALQPQPGDARTVFSSAR